MKRFADYIANGLFSESFGLPEMCWQAPVLDWIGLGGISRGHPIGRRALAVP